MKRINENPDGIETYDGQWQIHDHDSHTFIYRMQDELLFYGQTGKAFSSTQFFHHDMLSLFAFIGKIFDTESRYERNEETDDYDETPLPIETVDHFNDHCEMMGHDIYWDESGGWIRWKKRSMQIFGDTNKAVRFFKSMAGWSLEDSGNSYRQRYSAIGVMGRYWQDTEVSSFWLNKRDLGRLIAKGGLDAYFEYLGIDKGNARLNTIEKGVGIFTVQDALDAANKKRTLTKSQELELMKKQHLDADAKKKLHQSNDAPFDPYKGQLPVMANYYARQSDGVIKSGNVLKESPDKVYDGSGKRTDAIWYDKDAVAFFAFPMCSFIKKGGIHDEIWKGILQCYRQQNLAPFSGRYVSVQCSVSDDTLLELLKPTGFIGKLAQKDLDGEIKDIRNDLSGVVAGRVWTDKKIMSFWNEQRAVVENWSNVQLAFKKFFGNINDYNIDWLERDADVANGTRPRDMTPATKLSHTNKTSKDDDQTNATLKLLQDPRALDKVDDKILKQLRQQLHLLDPQAKAQVMKALGDIPTHKAAEIADKLGMSVAEFNHIMHVNETTIRLRNLMPDSYYRNVT